MSIFRLPAGTRALIGTPSLPDLATNSSAARRTAEARKQVEQTPLKDLPKFGQVRVSRTDPKALSHLVGSSPGTNGF